MLCCAKKTTLQIVLRNITFNKCVSNVENFVKCFTFLLTAALVYITDSQSFARLQEALRDSKRQVDKQRERIVALETSRKQMESDLAEVQE